MQIESKIYIEEPLGRLRFRFDNGGSFTFVSVDLIPQAKLHLQALDKLMQIQLLRQSDPNFKKEQSENLDN